MTSTTPTLAARIAEVRNHPQFAALRTLPSQVAFVPGGPKGDRLILNSKISSDPPPAAILRIIGQICRSGHALQPTGTYKPGNFLDSNVTKARLRFHLNAPLANDKDDHFSQCIADHDMFVENLKRIQDDAIDSYKSPDVIRPVADNKDVAVFHPFVVVSFCLRIFFGFARSAERLCCSLMSTKKTTLPRAVTHRCPLLAMETAPLSPHKKVRHLLHF